MLALPPTSNAEISREYILKAAFIIRFIRFSKWPDTITKQVNTDTFIVGILGNNPFETYLTEFAIKASQKLNQKIVIKTYQSISDIKQVPQILYFSDHHSTPSQLLKTYKDQPILTISDHNDFLNNCGIVRFYSHKNRVRFEINYGQAQAQQLSFSSKLMKVARIIKKSKTQCH